LICPGFLAVTLTENAQRGINIEGKCAASTQERVLISVAVIIILNIKKNLIRKTYH